MWKPKEIIIHNSIKDDPITQHIIEQCKDVPIKYVSSSKPETIKKTSDILNNSNSSMIDTILAGKGVLFIAPPGNDVVDTFTMPDDRMLCPHFDRLKLASNGCFYQCDWCYLKLTFRAAFPFITVRVKYDTIKKKLSNALKNKNQPVFFNSGELADSLSMEHLTKAAQEFIPWFGETQNGYLFMLTKSDNVDAILDLHHNNHTIIAWSMNNEWVSKTFEIGATSFEKRLEAARKIQQAKYPLRIRLDPIVPFDGWKEAYSDTVAKIFKTVTPERITLGTLRFEKGFYDMRKTFFKTGQILPEMIENMKPMFEPKEFAGAKKPKSGKYSFTEDQRIEIFSFIVNEIKKYSDCKIALCKESKPVWKKVGLDYSKCSCVCQLDYAKII